MATIINLVVTGDHAVPISVPTGGTSLVKNVSGGALFYADNPQVSPASNQGSLTAGQSLPFTAPVWVCSASASPSSALVTLTDAPPTLSRAIQTISLILDPHDPVPINPQQGDARLTVDSDGGTVYYGDTPAVSSTSNQGSILAGGSQVIRRPVWVRSSRAGTRCSLTVSDAVTPLNWPYRL